MKVPGARAGFGAISTAPRRRCELSFRRARVAWMDPSDRNSLQDAVFSLVLWMKALHDSPVSVPIALWLQRSLPSTERR